MEESRYRAAEELGRFQARLRYAGARARCRAVRRVAARGFSPGGFAGSRAETETIAAGSTESARRPRRSATVRVSLQGRERGSSRNKRVESAPLRSRAPR